MRWCKDDRGRSFIERGVEGLRLPLRARTPLTLLAVVGFLHSWLWISYILPYNSMAVKGKTAPAVPSYLRNGICGEGTNYACPSEFVPIPSKKSLSVEPRDQRLPENVRSRQH